MTNEEAVARTKELIANGKPFVMATVDADDKPQVRWMGALVPDPETEWVYYMECQATSRKIAQIGRNVATQLMFTSDDYMCVATLSGSAEVVNDADVKKAVWDAVPVSGDYFESPDSPGFGVVQIEVEVIEVLCMEDHAVIRVDLNE